MVLYPDVIDSLIKLKSLNFKLGLISNMDKLGSELLNEFKLSEYMDICVTSKEANVEKPDPQIFNLALSKLNIKPEEAIYVGDQILSDVEGASNSGMTPVLMDRENSHVNYENLKVTNLEDFIRLLFTQYN